jgi:hypothetical protein
MNYSNYTEKDVSMAFNPLNFITMNVVDTCAVWNILSSEILYRSAISAGVTMSVTGFVYYECALKERQKVSGEDIKLQNILKREAGKNINVYHLEIEDLQEIHILESRRNLGKGELSSIAFANRTRQAFLTDDQKARKLAGEVMKNSPVQTTPYLFGWLIYNCRVSDHEKNTVIEQHRMFKRPLGEYFEQMYVEALRYRLMAHQ